MPSPQELQNALMLKKANPNLTTAQAVNQARVPVTSTSQINQDQLAQNQASRQAPVTPTPTAPITQAPVDPTTGLSKPIESTTPIAPTNTGIATTQVTPKVDPTP